MNIVDIKKELSGDEKVLESAFKLETLYKKYKFIIWAVIIGLFIFFSGRAVMHTMNEAELAEANNAFLILQKNADDSSALVTLKEKNTELFELFTFAKASKDRDKETLTTLKNSKNEIIADISTYISNVLENKKSDSTLYREMAILEGAYMAIKSGNVKEAKSKLELIDEKSPLYRLASLLAHSTIKVK